MAFFTRHNRVPADQRKSRYVVIERGGLAPCGVLVALLAARTKLALMRIVLLVTGHACRREFFGERASVAGVALDFDVSAPQRKRRLVVIESHGLPPSLIVTSLAFGAVAAAMDILYLVTPDAGRGDAAIALASVTD